MRNCIDCAAQFEPKGRNARCAPCRREWEKAWRLRRKAEGRPVVTGKMGPEYEATRKDYYARPDVRERRAEAMRGYTKDPELRAHHQARWQVNRAVTAGRIARLPCERCGEAKSEAHHDDYTKPLDVRWLCKRHHIEAHAVIPMPAASVTSTMETDT